MTKVVCYMEDCAFNKNNTCSLSVIEIDKNANCEYYRPLTEKDILEVKKTIEYLKNTTKEFHDYVALDLLALYRFGVKTGKSDLRKYAVETARELFDKFKLSNPELMKEIKSLAGKKKKRGELKEIVIEMLKQKPFIYRKDLVKIGFAEGGSLTKRLKEMEKEGLIEIRTELINGHYHMIIYPGEKLKSLK